MRKTKDRGVDAVLAGTTEPIAPDPVLADAVMVQAVLVKTENARGMVVRTGNRPARVNQVAGEIEARELGTRPVRTRLRDAQVPGPLLRTRPSLGLRDAFTMMKVLRSCGLHPLRSPEKTRLRDVYKCEVIVKATGAREPRWLVLIRKRWIVRKEEPTS